jgi:hypothetical protein
VIHQRFEAGVMGGVEHMHQFVHYHVLEAHRWLFGRFGVEADRAQLGAAASPQEHRPGHPCCT